MAGVSSGATPQASVLCLLAQVESVMRILRIAELHEFLIYEVRLVPQFHGPELFPAAIQ